MKLSKLLVLSALSLFGLSAQATIVDGVRQAPEPETTAFAVGSQTDYFYLYNTTAKMFFTQGNTWGTRTCVGPHASATKMYFAESANADGTYAINNYVCIRSTSYSWKGASAEGTGHALYSDQSTSWGRPYWNVIPTTGNGFRLQSAAPYFSDTETDDGTPLYMGRDSQIPQDFYNAYTGFADDSKRYPVSDNVAEGEGHYVDWALVTPAAYNAIADAWVLYDKASELKAVLDDAKSQGVAVSAQEAVYLNEAATVEELEAAIEAVKEAIKQAAAQSATPENPANFSSLITNADCSSNTGWSGTAPALGSGAAEHYNKTYDTYQVVKGLPKGVFIVGVQGYYRAGSTADEFANQNDPTKRHAKLYATYGENTTYQPLTSNYKYEGDPVGVSGETTYTDTESGTTYTVPNTMASGAAYFERGDYKNSLYVVAADSVKIGLVKTEGINTDWTLWDNWTLSYIGDSPASYAAWLPIVKESVTIEEGAIYTQSYADAVNNATVTKFEEALAFMGNIDSLNVNIDLWKQLQALAAEGKAVVANAALDPDYMDDLSDWIDWDLDKDLAEHNFSNAELAAQVAEKQAWIDEAKKHPISETDATNLLTNPDFEQGTKGWTGFKTVKQVKWGNGTNNMPTTGGTSTNTCAEAFSSPEFDLYQVVENAPVGVYEISVQGFCRNGRGDAAWKNYQDQTTYSQPGKFPVYVYLNAAQTPFVNVFSEPVAAGYYKSINSAAEVYVNGEVEFPDGMVSSAIAFSDGMYTQKAYGLVAKEGDAMRIGVKGTSAGLDGEDDNWVIFDNFKLTWKGYQASVIKPVLEEQIVKSKETTSKAMDKDLFAELNAAIAAAEASLAEANGKVMFDCLSDLYDVDAKVTASAAVFAKLVAANENLAKEIEVATLAGRTSALAEATALNEQLTAGIEGHTIAEADVEAKINEINGLISRLRMPNQDKIDAASDENPVDMTSLIQNPTFDESANGWSGTTAAWGGDKGALAELFNQNYNFYQEFAGMPAGTYQVSVQAFYRSGAAVNDYNTLDSLNTTHAFLYGAAIQGTDTLMNAKPLQRLGAIVNFEGYEFKSISDETVTDYAVVVTDTIDKGTDAESYLRTFVPNMMNTANDAFLNGWFSDNVVTVKLAEGETLRIGLLKTTLLANDWTIFDNWKLTYFGKNSTKEATGDNVTAIRTLDGEGETVKVEFFTLDGRKAGAAQKGLIIVKQTLDNGSVIVKKIRK